MQTCAEKQITAIATEFIPRISRAQAMDTLSSQANLGGYKAVIMGAEHCPKVFPMMITAAGTLSPAKVFIIGAGVAGLQAIATARRLGAVVEAYDVRPATKEQVQSLGARFVELEMETTDAETSGGYAKEQTEEQQRKQTELMTKHIIGADVVVTTAAIFGKAPPMLISKDVVGQMHTGSVIVDLAASPEHGRGNCELTKPGEIFVTDNDVRIVGTLNLPSLLPTHASQAYANNMYNLLQELIVEGEIKIDLEDEIQKGAVVAHQGQIRIEM
jgi:NAD(P) transhydrogenase subunit alpha